MKKIIISVGISLYSLSFGQVGINTETPSATLDILSKGNTNTTKAFEVNNSDSKELFTILDNGNVGINNSTPSTILHIKNSSSPALRIEDGTQGNGKVLTSDTNGNASWQTIAVDAISGVLPNTSTSFSSYGAGTPPNISMYTGGYITLPAGKWLIGVGSTVSVNPDSSKVITSDGSLWYTAFFSDSASAGTVTADIDLAYTGQRGSAGVIARGANKSYLSGYCVVNNTSGGSKTYYLWVNQEQNGVTQSSGTNVFWQTPFGSGYWERYFFAIPIQ